MSDRHESDIGSWFLTGKNPRGYDTGPGWLRSKQPNTQEFGTIMKQLPTSEAPASAWLGKRIRFRGDVKTANVEGWAGLWMRVDGGPRGDEPSPILAFDNMQTRALRGSSDWAPHDVVLDVAPDATRVSFGLILSGDGEAWVRNTTIETVGGDVTSTEPKGTIERWIPEANLDPFLVALGWIIGRDFPAEERGALRAGLSATDHGEDRWHEHALADRPSVRLSMAREIKTRGIRIRLDVAAEHRARLNLALALLARYVLIESMLDVPE